jgi:hypothetical protein
MLIVDHTINGITISKQFPETPKGNNASVKYIQQLYSERKNYPWYHRLKQIELLEEKLKFKAGKKKVELEAELYREKKEREEHLQICEVNSPPPLIKLSIYRK